MNNKNFPFILQLGYRPFLNIVKLGVRRGMKECEKQFKESSRLNCSIVRKLINPELPIFVNTTLPLGKNFQENILFGLSFTRVWV